MKKFLYPLLASLLASGSAIAEAYLLDKKDYMPAVGTILVSEKSMVINNLKIIITFSNGEKNTLNGGSTEKEELSIKVTSPNTLEQTLLVEQRSETMEHNGEKFPANQKKQHPLLKTPIILTVKDSKWTAKAKNEKFNQEQQEKVDEFINRKNSSKSIYGLKPRKIGDKWEVDAEDAASILGYNGEDRSIPSDGKLKFHFLGLENFKGQKCAKLKCDFEFVGEVRNLTITAAMKGQVTILRSLTHFADLSVTGKIQLSDEETENEMNMKMSGEAKLNILKTITNP